METTEEHEQDRLMNGNRSMSDTIPDPLPAGPGDSNGEQQAYRLHPDPETDGPGPSGPPVIIAGTGKPAGVAGTGDLIKRRSRPFVAISEAKQMAMALGFTVIELVMDEPGPFDFAIHDSGSYRLVRVRRLRQNEYRIESIIRSCAREISEFRDLDIPEGIGRELWVRGPQRTFRRYRVAPETIEAIPVVPRSGSLPGETRTQGERGFTKKRENLDK
jgi:hypothetical protein